MRESSAAAGPLRIALIGCGRFGRIHARRLREHPDFSLCCVVDPAAQARAHARSLGLRAVAALDQLPADLDAASVVTPAATHAELATALMRRGLHVLVEKPLAASEAALDELLATAQATGRRLCTGHLERFNPALASPPWAQAPGHLSFWRQSRQAGRGRDAVLDLMVHDLDLAAHLLACPAHAPYAVLSVHEQGRTITARVRLGDCVVDLQACCAAESSRASLSWAAPGPQTLCLSESPGPGQTDALTRQYTSFHHQLRGACSRPLANGEDGALAVRRALAILARL